jgi:flagellum-specific peptidoglycan hydrolase FlgJ
MKRNIFILIFCLVVPQFVAAQAKKLQVNLDYVEKYGDVAIHKMQQHGIPASITLAQGILESGAGNSELAKSSNNHFGIKCHNDWVG